MQARARAQAASSFGEKLACTVVMARLAREAGEDFDMEAATGEEAAREESATTGSARNTADTADTISLGFRVQGSGFRV